jgi:hypothetical protein
LRKRTKEKSKRKPPTLIYSHNLEILCQGREDNPMHTDVFNELIENLKEKNPTWNKTTFNYERLVTRSLFMEENNDGDR